MSVFKYEWVWYTPPLNHYVVAVLYVNRFDWNVGVAFRVLVVNNGRFYCWVEKIQKLVVFVPLPGQFKNLMFGYSSSSRYWIITSCGRSLRNQRKVDGAFRTKCISVQLPTSPTRSSLIYSWYILALRIDRRSRDLQFSKLIVPSRTPFEYPRGSNNASSMISSLRFLRCLNSNPFGDKWYDRFHVIFSSRGLCWRSVSK